VNIISDADSVCFNITLIARLGHVSDCDRASPAVDVGTFVCRTYDGPLPISILKVLIASSTDEARDNPRIVSLEGDTACAKGRRSR